MSNLAFETMQFAQHAHCAQQRTENSAGDVIREVESQSKRCSACSLELAFREFNKCARARHGLHNHCRACLLICRKRHYIENAEESREASRIRCRSPEYKAARKHRNNNDLAFRFKLLQANRERRKTPAARIAANVAKRRHEQENPSAKLARNLRVRVRKAMIGVNKSLATSSLLGCSSDEFREH